MLENMLTTNKDAQQLPIAKLYLLWGLSKFF